MGTTESKSSLLIEHMTIKKFVYQQLKHAIHDGIVSDDIKLEPYNDIDTWFFIILPDGEEVSVASSHTGYRYAETLSKSSNDNGNPKSFSTQDDFYAELNQLAQKARSRISENTSSQDTDCSSMIVDQ